MKWRRILIVAGIIAALAVIGTSVALADGGNEGKEGGEGWIHYGDVLVYWEPAVCDGVAGYHYWWGVDRNLNGIPGDGWVEIDYGKYGGLQWKYEPCYEHNCYTDFGCYPGLMYFTDQVIHLEEYWVPGVTVPGGENKFVVKDNDGDGIYTGGYSTVLFWDGMTQQGDPPGPYNIQNKFLYTYDATGLDGLVVGGNYVQMQYMMIPDEE